MRDVNLFEDWFTLREAMRDGGKHREQEQRNVAPEKTRRVCGNDSGDQFGQEACISYGLTPAC